MDTHKKLMISVLVLAVIHALLSVVMIVKHKTLTSGQLLAFLTVSVVVCLTISGLAAYCMQLF